MGPTVAPRCTMLHLVDWRYLDSDGKSAYATITNNSDLSTYYLAVSSLNGGVMGTCNDHLLARARHVGAIIHSPRVAVATCCNCL